MSNLPAIRKEIMSDTVVSEIQDALPTAIGKHAKEIAVQFVKTGYATISQNPTLQECTIKSLVRSMQQSASVNLPIDKRQLAFLVPYRNKQGQWEAQLQISYLGLMELAYRSDKVKSISAHCIYESERDSVKIKRMDGRFIVEHPFTFQQPSGDMIAVYATAEVEGIPPQTVVLRIEEVEKFRSKSKAPDSPAWKEFYDAMAKKTAIRQLAKFLPKSVAKDFTMGAMIDEYEDFVTAQIKAGKLIRAEQGSEPIDTTFEPNGDVERDPETQAKIDQQKKDLQEDIDKGSQRRTAKRDKKKRGRPKKTKPRKDNPKPYICGKCNRLWESNELLDKEGQPQCPKCLSLNIQRNPACGEVPEFMEDEEAV